MAYFIDSTAMLEIARGNKNFEKFLNEELHTSLHSLHEFHTVLLKETDNNTAEQVFSKFRSLALNFDDSLLFKASKLMIDSELKISHADSIGLALATQNYLKSLTSNPSLKTLSNTLFVQ
jgi:predicted nucleic acid-binding protein